jgi:hypothetical protein
VSIQVLAVRMLAEGDDLHNIGELVYRDDGDGKLGYMDRGPFAEWVNDNPHVRVYLRTHLGENKVVLTFEESGERFVKTEESLSSRDSLLRLPRFSTPTQPMASESTLKAESRPLGSLWWLWWLPR